MLVAMSKRLASHGGHSKILRDAQLRKLSRAIESRWATGVRGRHRQGAGQAGSVEADDESYSDGLERYVRAACVSLSRSESSHENARVPHTRCGCALAGSALWDHSKQSGLP